MRSSTASTSPNFLVTLSRRTAPRRGSYLRLLNMRSIFGSYHESLTATCLMRVYSSIEYSDMSLP